MPTNQNTRNRSGPLLLTLGLTASLFAAGWMLFHPSRPELDGNTYGIAVALYRVCNQKDSDGLADIENALRDLPQQDLDGVLLLNQIVQQARDGRWKDAMKDTRRILDDQSNRS